MNNGNMILIADSGSTKTDWRLIDNHQVTSFQTIGLNPYHTDESTMLSTIRSLNIAPFKGNIFFYGSGCANELINKKIYTALSIIFPDAKIEIYSDILGAARGLCRNEPGIVSILGTGAGTALYNGKEISQTGTSLGYILGDDGSGSHLGKELIRAIFFKELPKKILQNFKTTYDLNRQKLLENVYQKPFPNRYLASFAEFLYKHKEVKEIDNIINKCFFNFFEYQVTKIPDYNSYKLFFTGSIAYYFHENLKNIATIYALKIAAIEKSPIKSLELYHN